MPHLLQQLAICYKFAMHTQIIEVLVTEKKLNKVTIRFFFTNSLNVPGRFLYACNSQLHGCQNSGPGAPAHQNLYVPATMDFQNKCACQKKTIKGN